MKIKEFLKTLQLTVFFSLMPLWLKFDQMRSSKDLETSDDCLNFKKLKVPKKKLVEKFGEIIKFNFNLQDYKSTDSSLSFNFDYDKEGSKVRHIF